MGRVGDRVEDEGAKELVPVNELVGDGIVVVAERPSHHLAARGIEVREGLVNRVVLER